jgi:DNA-binding NtrC family response regulator
MDSHPRPTPAPVSPYPEGVPVVPGFPPRRALVAGGSEATRLQLRSLLGDGLGLHVDTAADGGQALEALLGRRYSLLVTDLPLPRLGGLQLLGQVRARGLLTPVIVTAGHGDVVEAVRAMRLGASDFLTGPLDPGRLRRAAERALREYGPWDEVAGVAEYLQARYGVRGLLSKSPRLHAVCELIGRTARTAATVLIEGETGTGKELVARALHQAAPDRPGPLIAVNCAAVPGPLLESELFGHERGAFTGAAGQRRGRFEQAQGGTLFLDEVGDTPAAAQAKLLRALQERRFERVGGTETVAVDVRVLAATNRPLRQLVEDGRFRKDLYYRLNVVRIELPPLRERPEDIPLLAAHFTRKYARAGRGPRHLSAEALQALRGYRWPGNVRELENAIQRACLTARGEAIRAGDLPPELTGAAEEDSPLVDLRRPLPEVLHQVTAEIERRYLCKALRRAGGNVRHCARLCGLSERSIGAKVDRYRIDRSRFRER